MLIKLDDAIAKLEALFAKMAQNRYDRADNSLAREVECISEQVTEALRALPVSDGWEDIATAKQDGEWIIACRAGQEDSIGPVRWWRGRWAMADGEVWKAGWLTHWKPLGPLPAPPTIE